MSPFPETQHLHAMAVEDDTDLTTLVGDGDKYKGLVMNLFDTGYGHVQWKGVKGYTKDTFLKRYGKGDPSLEDFLRCWMKDFGLEGQFAAIAARSGKDYQADGEKHFRFGSFVYYRCIIQIVLC